ncbi:hypothetical protein EU805_09510 [Salipiger sp. IMCC34102]|uniref:hypothetical protein n=1 Tax=Salipiger sp. IMCC34102 TaxID=2510647 RepID=UPI00101DC7BC|nr:hypothetical protein [Salipiger sp. IMCC34102]RYH02823.1 hypothetical protein EU805_09510 [Salipiger sp. IMCC34102]
MKTITSIAFAAALSLPATEGSSQTLETAVAMAEIDKIASTAAYMIGMPDHCDLADGEMTLENLLENYSDGSFEEYDTPFLFKFAVYMNEFQTALAVPDIAAAFSKLCEPTAAFISP